MQPKKNGLSFWKLVKISEPLLWPFYPLVFYGGVFFAGGSLNFYQIILMILMTFPLGLAGYGLNDAYDYKSDLENPRKGGILGCKITKSESEQLKKISLIISALFYIFVLASGKAQFILIMTLFGLISYLYIVPPFRLKGKAPFDVISSALVMVEFPFAAGFSYHKNLIYLPWKIHIITLCLIAGHAISTIMDMKIDKKFGDKTFAVRYGARATSIFAFLIFLSVFIFVNFSPYIRYFVGVTALLNFILIFNPKPELVRKSFIIFIIVTLIVGIYYLFFYLL